MDTDEIRVYPTLQGGSLRSWFLSFVSLTPPFFPVTTAAFCPQAGCLTSSVECLHLSYSGEKAETSVFELVCKLSPSTMYLVNWVFPLL